MESQTEDLQDVIKFSRGKGYTDICLCGTSQGVTNSVQAYDEDIKCMVMWSPVLKHDLIYERYKDAVLKDGFIIRPRHLDNVPVKIGKPMWESFGRTDESETLKKITCPVIMIMGSEEEPEIKERIKRWVDFLPGKHILRIIEGQDHDMFKNKDDGVSFALGWVERYL